MQATEAKGLKWTLNLKAMAEAAVEFSRNPNDFPVNRYGQICPAKRAVGKYLRLDPDSPGKLLSDAAPDFMFHDGPDEPATQEPVESFEFRDYEAERFRYGFVVPKAALDQAEWDIVGSQRRMHCQRAMLTRTSKGVGLLADESSYAKGHVGDVLDDRIVYRQHGHEERAWDAATIMHPVIRQALKHGAETIQRATLAAVCRSDLRLVIAPELAVAMGATQELHQYVREHGYGTARYEKDYKLPDVLYGVEVVVEDAVRIVSRKGECARERVMPSNVAALVARVGGLALDPEEAVKPSLSFLTLLMHREMDVEDATDEETGDKHSGVIDQFQAVVTSPISGFLFKNVLA